MNILGIETSCDETGIAIYNSDSNKIFDYTHSQINIHRNFGGTIPEIASREHIKKLSTLVLFILKKSKISINNIDYISYTKGPGLSSSLFIGITFAKTLSFSLDKPCIGVNHLKSHISIAKYFNIGLKYPFLTLLVSGAHTMLLNVKNYNEYLILGESYDDGAGEVFDKISRFLGLGYPGGPCIEKIFENCKEKINLGFPIPMIKSKDFNFSFSGLKTFVINYIKSNKDVPIDTIVYNFQLSIIKSLVNKCEAAIKFTSIKSLVIAGGVSANKFLREEIMVLKEKYKINIYLIPIKYCTDNGAMVAYEGYINVLNGSFEKDNSINVYPNLSF